MPQAELKAPSPSNKFCLTFIIPKKTSKRISKLTGGIGVTALPWGHCYASSEADGGSFMPNPWLLAPNKNIQKLKPCLELLRVQPIHFNTILSCFAWCLAGRSLPYRLEIALPEHFFLLGDWGQDSENLRHKCWS